MRHSLIALLLAACGSTVTQTTINTPPHAMWARAPQSIEIFSSGPPSRPHVDVAILQIEQDSGYSLDGSSDMIAKLRAHAARLGCDALVISGPDNGAAGKNTMTLHGYFATCIAYTDDNPVAAHAAIEPFDPANDPGHGRD